MKTKISVVVVTFNGSKWLDKMLQSVFNSSVEIELLIVDNASTDNSVAIIEKYDKVHLIKSNVNLGFGKANNIGIKAALQKNADFVFLLNQDTWIFEKTIEIVVNTAQKHNDLGIVSPLHLSANEKDLDQNFKIYYQYKSITDDPNVAEVPFVNAAAWLISKECFAKIGLFEPFFNHYGEDRNFCNRLQFHGFKVGIVKATAIVHDRISTRSFKKDILQSEYKILNAFLNINTHFFQSCVIAFKNVFGLPKFFFYNYSIFKIVIFFFKLLFYFFKNLATYQTIISIRSQSKKGINGL